ncbi:hypothetical protein [Hohaiivirga grylli]
MISGPLYAADSNKNPEKSFSYSDYQRIKTTDFYMNPGLYANKPISFSGLVCQKVSDGFACSSTNNRIIVLAPDLAPASEKKLISERCNPKDKLFYSRCKRTILFVSSSIEGQKGENYNQQSLVIRTKIINAATLDEESEN